MMNISKKIFVALDNPDFDYSFNLANDLKNHIAGIKLGLEFFTANGPTAIKKFTDAGIPIFLDLKFHDIPNTVKQAVTQASRLGVSMLTVHASGGTLMLRSAAEAAYEYSQRYNTQQPKIIAVTILTSMSKADLVSLGIRKEITNQALELARLAKNSKLDGIVCSPHEVEIIKENIAGDFLAVTPGIRLEEEIKNNNVQDQKRVLSPTEAIQLGSDFLVMGRSITNSKNPIKILKEL